MALYDSVYELVLVADEYMWSFTIYPCDIVYIWLHFFVLDLLDTFLMLPFLVTQHPHPTHPANPCAGKEAMKIYAHFIMS